MAIVTSMTMCSELITGVVEAAALLDTSKGVGGKGFLQRSDGRTKVLSSRWMKMLRVAMLAEAGRDRRTLLWQNW